ncbi:muscle M-line assembly protein unc-89 isoform X2 [Phlebotomus argentipes]|uniref:muscle M-line assembly protein unc-89 isoform X2 n=1 Tax=Phlebotomus argentipes TaxID=94469 RepID=UPI0028932C13|nr:muscle M-line assembly protein unc-89 isoform X2 [Phlebotomus argentipes]
MDARDKENILENPTPRRMTRLTKSLMNRDLPDNVTMRTGKAGDIAKPAETPRKTPAKTPKKTPKKSAVKETPKKSPKKTPKKSAKKDTPKKALKDGTPKKTPEKSGEEVKSISKSTSKKTRSTKKDEIQTSGGSLRITRSRSIHEQLTEDENSSSCKNLFPEDATKAEINVPEAKLEAEDEVAKEIHQENDESAAVDVTVTVLKEQEEIKAPEKLVELPENCEELELKSIPLEVLAEELENEEKLADESCVIIDDTSSMEGKDIMKTMENKSIIVIPDTPMLTEDNTDRPLNETFSADEEEVPIKTPLKKTPKRLNIASTSQKMVNFAPAIASSALKSSILLDNKIMSPLKSIRKRSFSTTDVESRKMNHVTFHSPANMEITVDEIDDGMRPHIEEIRLEREAHKARDKKLAKRVKRSMSNTETESGRKRALQLSVRKTPMKASGQSSLILGKMPNFGAIHAASFSNMENLDDYTKRKLERAKNLLGSNGKPLYTSTVKKNTSVEMQEAKKEDKKEDNQSKNEPIAAPGAAKKVAKIVPLQEGGSKAAHVGTSRPLKTVEERQQKWRSMHKSGRHDNQGEKKSAILKGVRSNRRFDLLMKFRESQN